MKPASPTGIDVKLDHRAQGVGADCFMNIVLIANGLTYRGEHSYRLIQEVSGVLSRRSIRHIGRTSPRDAASTSSKCVLPIRRARRTSAAHAS